MVKNNNSGMKIEISKLTPHPLNSRIYGYTDSTDLIESIEKTGWIKPILISRNNTIISGHRRAAACVKLGILEIDFEYVLDDYIKQLELFVGENCYREKNATQKTREATLYLEIEKKKAYQRMIHSEEPVETFPEAAGNSNVGNSRDIVAEKVGMSGRSLDKALKVVEKMDSTYDDTFVEFFKATLNENIDAASKLVSKSDDIIKEVYDRTEGDPTKVSGVIRAMAKEGVTDKIHLPSGKFQILLLDLTKWLHMIMLNTTIAEISEPDCVLFTWVKPDQLEIGLEISKHWGFRYSSCLVWNRDTDYELSDFAEICLVTVKGSPKSIMEHYPAAKEKPSMLKEVINSGYHGWSRVEIFTEEGWRNF
jgi:hypothetical protein